MIAPATPAVLRGDTMRTDKNGVKYYDADEAMDTLGVKRTTFTKRLRESKIPVWRPRSSKKYYYRVDDIERLKDHLDEVIPVENDHQEETE